MSRLQNPDNAARIIQPRGQHLVDRLPPPSVASQQLRDGSVLLRSRLPLLAPRASVIALLDEAAVRHPDRAFLRARSAAGDWDELSFGAAQRQSRGIGQWLLDNGLGPGDKIAVLCTAGLAHAAFAFGAMRAQIALTVLNPLYAKLGDTRRLAHCLDITRPKMLLVDSAEEFAAVARTLEIRIPIVALGESGTGSENHGTSPFLAATRTAPSWRIYDLEQSISKERIARIVFTSGSAGLPKAVPQTHGMLTAAVAQTESMGLLDFSAEHPQLLDGLPWHHIFGGNHNFNTALRAGATITLDDGKPTKELFGKTVENLKQVRPSYIATVPLAFALLCDALENDAALRERLLPNLEYLLFGGAGLHGGVVSRLNRLIEETVGRPIPVLSTYGSSEVQLVGAVHWLTSRTDLLGVPVPGTDIKLTPVGGKLEMRIRGPSVMPRSGYIGNEAASARAFDDDGFYLTGDAAILAEPDRPEAGLIFDGRLAEEFKLATGTWVSAGNVRQNVLEATSPLLLEAVVCAPGRDELGLLAWLNPGIARNPSEQKTVTTQLRQRIEAHNSRWQGSSMRIARVLIMEEALSNGAHEVTDKGTVNLNRVWQTRKADIERLFAANPGADPAANPDPDVIVLPATPRRNVISDDSAAGPNP